MNKIKFPQLVKCINGNFKVEYGEKYIIDLTTVWMDSDGDAYVEVYDYVTKDDVSYIGEHRLNRFQSLLSLESRTIA